MTPREQRARDIFMSAMELPPDEQQQFLDQQCGHDAALRAEVADLLSHQAKLHSFLESNPQGSAAVATMDADPRGAAPVAARHPAHHGRQVDEQPGAMIGRYKLLQKIGEGGFGSVWMAEQVEPVSRRVALKIIKMGMDTREVIARFEAERQALAMMDHPNIARVFDAGATDRGRPFFVMELVKGMPITQYCDEAGLETRRRLELFRDVCSAINHAHQKGIIHRDIKPSNVLITLYADKPVVKVIDFGIVKATQGKLTDQTLFTRFEQFIGTPVYMSPEQAALSAVDIDTRSDIYALGVLLYELLVGKPPFDGKSLVSAGYEEMRRIIREVEPVKPSSRLSTIAGEERTLLAKARHVDEGKLNKLVEPDLDWIVMKAIDKDRTRRYETANAFAQDIVRFLSDQPVTATPPSAAYQFRKFARRNKAAFAAGTAIAASLVIGIAASAWQAVRATRAERNTAQTLAQVAAERDAKEIARRAATDAEALAKTEAQRATEAQKLAGERLAESEQARKEAETIAKFMANVFISPVPGRDGRNVTVVQALNRAVKKLDTDLTNQPATRIRLLETIASTYFELKLHQEGIPIQKSILNYQRAALGPDDPDTLRTAQFLMAFYRIGKRHHDAIKLAEEYLPRMREKLGSEHRLTVYATSLLAGAYFGAGRKDEALALRQEMVPLMRKAFGSEHGLTLWVMTGLAESLADAGQKDEALKLLDEILRIYKAAYGTEFPSTQWAMHTLALAYYEAGRHEEAMKLEQEAALLMNKVLEPQHPWTITATQTLKRWRGELPATPESSPGATLAEALAETLSQREETVASDIAEFWGERARDSRVTRLARSGLELSKQPDGTWEANLSKVKDFSDLTIFQDTRLSRLVLTGTGVVDLTPLRGLALRELNLNETKVADLEPLHGMPLEALRLTHTGVSDLSPLRGLPLSKLFVNGTGVENLEPLRGMKLTELSLAGTGVSDLSVLQGMPLVLLKLGKCEKVTDLSPIRDCTSLAALTLPPNAKDIGFLSRFQGLTRISYTENAKAGWVPDKTAAEFWKDYDATKK